MSELTPISKAQLARHWKVSPAYVTKISRGMDKPGGKAMPTFFTLDHADAWRAINCPAQPGREASATSPTPPAGRASQIASSATPPAASPAAAAAAAEPMPEIVDIEPYIDHAADFTSLMIKQSKEVPQIAYGLYRLACKKGLPSGISHALANWNDAAKASAGTLSSYIEIQERAKVLIPLDHVMDIVGTELQSLRSLLDKLGVRVGPKANPTDPALAASAIDAAIDEIFKAFDRVAAISPEQLAAG